MSIDEDCVVIKKKRFMNWEAIITLKYIDVYLYARSKRGANKKVRDFLGSI